MKNCFGTLALLATVLSSPLAFGQHSPGTPAGSKGNSKAAAAATSATSNAKAPPSPARQGLPSAAGPRPSTTKTDAYTPVTTALVKPGPLLDAAPDAAKKLAAEAMRAGKTAFEKGKYQEALGEFLKSYQSAASPNSRMMLSRSLARLGRVSEAYREGKAAHAEATAAALKNPKYKKTVDELTADIADMEKKLAFVTVKIEGEPDEATLTVGGEPVGREDWGKPIALVPGLVNVELATPDGKTTESVKLQAGKKSSVRLEMPRATVADEKQSEPEVRIASTWTGPNRKTIGYIAAGVGGAGMLAFGTFGALSNGQYSRLESGCPSRVGCDPALADVADRGKAYQAVANASLVLGVVGVVTGASFLTWEAVDGGGWPWDDAGIVKPTLAVGPGSVSLSGRF